MNSPGLSLPSILVRMRLPGSFPRPAGRHNTGVAAEVPRSNWRTPGLPLHPTVIILSVSLCEVPGLPAPHLDLHTLPCTPPLPLSPCSKASTLIRREAPLPPLTMRSTLSSSAAAPPSGGSAGGSALPPACPWVRADRRLLRRRQKTVPAATAATPAAAPTPTTAHTQPGVPPPPSVPTGPPAELSGGGLPAGMGSVHVMVVVVTLRAMTPIWEASVAFSMGRGREKLVNTADRSLLPTVTELLPATA